MELFPDSTFSLPSLTESDSTESFAMPLPLDSIVSVESVEAWHEDREVAPGVSEFALSEARRICQETLLPNYSSKPEEQKTLLSTFEDIQTDVMCYNPNLLQDLVAIVNLTNDSQRKLILEHINRGMTLGPKVMRRFSLPLEQALESTITDDNRDVFLQKAENFKVSLNASFAEVYLHALSTFAGILQSPTGKLTATIFNGSRRIGYKESTKEDNIDNALYALQLANIALLRVFSATTPQRLAVVNGSGSGSKRIIFRTNNMIDSVEAQPVEMYIRSETEFNRIEEKEFGKGRMVQASISFLAHLGHKDRRGKGSRLTSFVNMTKQQKLAAEHAQVISFRLDFEGGDRGAVFDFGGIAGDIEGLSNVVAVIFALGDIRAAKREGRAARLNHSPLQCDDIVDANTFKMLANSVQQANMPRLFVEALKKQTQNSMNKIRQQRPVLPAQKSVA